MKKILIAVITFAATLPGLASAGLYSPGYVTVTDTTLYATMSVRHNAAQGSAYVMSQEWANGVPTFYARNNAGKVFFCYVPIGSPIFQQARDAHNNLGNGSYIRASKPAGSNVCNLVMHDRRSYYMD